MSEAEENAPELAEPIERVTIARGSGAGKTEAVRLMVAQGLDSADVVFLDGSGAGKGAPTGEGGSAHI